jgi:hypothetical protein
LWQAEEPNELERLEDLFPEINFAKTIEGFNKQFQKDLKSGLSPVFLLAKSDSMGGELFLRKIKNLLAGKIRKSYPIKIRFQSQPSSVEILHNLATYVNIKPTNEQNWQAYATNIIDNMFKPLRSNSDVIFIELKNCHYLADDVLGWFVNEFWTLVASKLSTIPRNYIRYLCDYGRQKN